MANFLTEKMGPLPTWGWMAIVTGLLVGYEVIKGKSSSNSTSAQAQQQLLAAEEAAAANAAQTTPNYNYGNGHQGRSMLSTTPATTTSPAPVASTSTPVTVQVPNGLGAWMTATFPNATALQNYYTSLGITGSNGSYPTGLTNSQVTSHVQAAGGTVTQNANKGPAGSVYGEPNTTY